MSDLFGQSEVYMTRPKAGDQQAEQEWEQAKVRELVGAHARDEADEALLLDVLGIGGDDE